MTEETNSAAQGAKVGRAKPQIEVEMERKAEEAAIARGQRVGRAKPLMEIEANRTKGDVNKMVSCRVLNKGEGRIQTGENPPAFFAAGCVFEVNEVSAIQLEARGYAERTRD